MSDNITLAFAGPADVTPAAIKALLNDYLGFGPDDADGFPLPSDREIELVFPIQENHLSPGLQNVLAWSADVDLPYTAITNPTEKHKGATRGFIDDAAEVIPNVNVNAKIVDILSHAKGEGVLVLLWGEGEEGGDEDTEVLLDLALAENIKVVDLTAGLDDMTFAEEEPEEEVVPEPEPPVRAKRGTRGRKAAAEAAVVEEEKDEVKPARRGRSRKAEEPLVQEEVALTDDEGNDTTETSEEAIAAIEAEVAAEADAAIAKRAAKKAAKATKDYNDRLAAAKEANPTHAAAADNDKYISAVGTDGTTEFVNPVFGSLDLIKGTLSSVWLYLQSEVENDALLMLDEKVQESPLAEAVREALEALEGVATVTKEARVGEPKRGRGRPRNEPDPEVDTSAYFEDGDGIIRAATRGRPRRGETRVELTAAQVAEKTEAGLLDDK